MKFKFGRSSGYSLAGGGGSGTTGEISYTAPTITTNTPGGPSTTSPSHRGGTPGVTNAAPAANPNTRPTGGGRGGGGSGGTSPRAAPPPRPAPPPLTPTTTPLPGDGQLQVDTSLSEENMAATLRPGGSANGGYYPSPSSDGASDGTPSEEHPEFVDISVVLPDGRTCEFTVEYGKQMMDLLVQVAAGNKLSPASHTIQIYNEENGRQLDYKASQSIGSLKVSTLHLVSKKTDKKADRPKSVQPFEKTQRLTVNLPRNQKFVTRVNPKLRLADIYKMVCEEKKLDPYKYDLRHPTHPDQALNMAAPLGDYGINEIFVVSVGASESRAAADLPVTPSEPLAEPKVESSSAMPRLSRKSSSGASNDEGASSGGYMPGQDGEKKKKKGFLSFLSKKKAGSFKLGSTMSSEPVYARSQPEERQLPPAGPTVITHTQSVSSRSHSSGGSGPRSPVSPEVIVEQRAPQAPKPAPSRRKRAAPAPPQQQAVQQLVSNRSSRAAPAPPPPAPAASPPPPADPVIVESPPVEVTPVHTPPPPITLNHSRNSSHSSGFDESNVSPIESPGTSTRTDVSSKTITSIDATSIESGAVESPKQNTVTVVSTTTTTKMTKSQSMPVKGNRPPTGQTQLISSASLNTLRRKKRKAPAPPPPTGAIKSPAPKPTQDEQHANVGGITSTQQTEVVTTQQEVTPIPTPSIPQSNIKMPNGEIETHDEVMTEERIAEEARIQARLTDLTKDVDDGASTSSFGSLERRGPCQFVPPPPPDTPPPPETPISQERARSFNFSNGGIPTVVDSSIQAHVSSPCSVTKRAHSTASLDTIDDITDCFESTIAAGEEALALEMARDEGDFSLPSVSSDVHQDSVDAGDGESTSEGSSVQAYEVNAEQFSTADEEEKKDGEKADSDEDLPLYPQDPEGIVLIKKTSTSEFLTDNLLEQQKAEKEEMNERKIRGDTSETTETVSVQQDHVTVVSVGGEPDGTAASDSGHSSATMDKSEEIQDVLENEITFGDEDVLYVEPLNPGNPVAKEEYLNQVERERIESAASEEEEKQGKPVEDGPPLILQEAREAAARAAAAYESKHTPQKSPSTEGPLTTSTPMVQSVSSVPSTEDSFYRAASPVLPPATVQEEEAVETEETGRERKESETLSEEGEVFFAVNDYRIAGLIKEEVVEFSFPKNSKPVEIKQKKEEPKQPMVTSLRSRYNKRPIIPHEPLDLPDLEAMGLLAPKKVLPPPPAEPAPPIPSEPPEPISIRHEVKPVQSEKIYIAPAQESVTDPDMEDGLIEVSATGEVLHLEDSADLSIPNEAEPETLERDRAYEYRMAQKEDTKVESKPVGILKHSSFSESSTSAPTKGILKASSVEADAKPAGILKNKDTPDRIYSSMTSLDKDDTEVVATKQYSSIGNLSSEKDEDTQVITRPKINTKRNLGVYGPRPWGASKLKTDTNIMEEINTRFSDRYNNNGPTSPTQKTDVQQRLDELGFSPGMERERENVLEEKSLTMMNLKASSWRSPTEVSVDKNVTEKNKNFSKATEGVTSQRPHSRGSFDAEDANKSLQSQYEDLQKQFNSWEKQLKANQALLAQKNIPEVSSSVKTVQKTRVSPVQSSVQSEPRSPVTSNQGLRKIDARYEPPKKTSLDTGGGGRFTTNDLLSARSRLKSSTTEDDEDIEGKCGITVGRVVDTLPSQSPRLSSTSVPSPPPPPPVIPYTPAPDTSNFPAPPKRYIIDAPAPKSDQQPSRFAPKLEPREELMITIRNSGGRTGLRRVPVNETRWAAQ